MFQVRQNFHEELAALEQELLQMGTMTGDMVARAVEALVGHDTALARRTCVDDDQVDAEFKSLREQRLI